MPMIVTTISAPATSHAIAIQRPPKRTQRMLRRSGSGAMASVSQIAELAAQISLARGDLLLHRPQSRLKVAEAALEFAECIVGRGGDAAPEGGLRGARVERRRPLRQGDRQEDIEKRRRHDEEEKRQHKGEADDDALGAEILGDTGADPGKDSALGVAIEASATVRHHVTLP